jgi:ADP-ribose pyrophosphatase YjhB (NUDIX family)
MSESIVRFCIRCGTLLEPRSLFGRERPFCPACGWIYFTDPKVAAAMLVERDGQVLLARRANEPQQGRWGLPAGFVDADEDPAAAAVRECLEETGLEVQVTGLLDVIAGREHARGADIFIVYRGAVTGGQLRAGDDADRVEFFPIDALPPLAFERTQKAVFKVVNS